MIYHLPVGCSLRWDLSTISQVAGLVILGSGIVATWSLLKYRVDALETRVKELETQVAAQETRNTQQVAEVKCLICQAHNIPCPGC